MENISGAVNPLKRPKFKELLEFIKEKNIGIILMWDMTRFYRASSPTESLMLMKDIMNKYNVVFEFAREPIIEDPILRELWEFIKAWFSSYERLQISMRTKLRLARLKSEGKLYHKPSLIHYYASWLFGKGFKELTKKEFEIARKQLKSIVEKYWNNPAIKKRRIGEILEENELREMYIRFPKAPKDYLTFYRLMKTNGS